MRSMTWLESQDSLKKTIKLPEKDCLSFFLGGGIINIINLESGLPVQRRKEEKTRTIILLSFWRVAD